MKFIKNTLISLILTLALLPSASIRIAIVQVDVAPSLSTSTD